MTELMAGLVAAVRAHALVHYNEDGWDFLVECWEDHEIASEIGRATTVAGAIKHCRETVKLMNELRDDVRRA